MLVKLTGNVQEDINTVLADLAQLSTTLREHTQKLYDSRTDLYTKKRLKKSKQKELTQTHDRLRAAIANETNYGSKKPKFSNDIKRQAEFLERSAGDASCNELEIQIDSIALKISEIDVEIEGLLFFQSLLKDDYTLGLQLLGVFGNSLAGVRIINSITPS